MIRLSKNALYRSASDFELWAQVLNDELVAQLHFCHEGQPKFFENFSLEGSEIDDKNFLLEIIAYSPTIQVRSLENIVQLVYSCKFSNPEEKTIKFKEVKNRVSKKNDVLMKMMNDKERELSQSFEDPEPISHHGSNYRFSASYSYREKKIDTTLMIEYEKKKKKEYRNSIDETYFSKQLREAFINIEYLFEHLRNISNYQIIFDKGRIRVVNEPKTLREVLHLRRKAQQMKGISKNLQVSGRSNSSRNIPTEPDTELDFKSESSSRSKRNADNQNRKIYAEIDRVRNDLSYEIDRKLSSTYDKITQSIKKQIKQLRADLDRKKFNNSNNNNQNCFNQKLFQGMKFDNGPLRHEKFDVQILEEWKNTIKKDMALNIAREDAKVKGNLTKIISQAKEQLAIIIYKMRAEFEHMINENEEKCMSSIDDLETDLIKKIEGVVAVKVKDDERSSNFTIETLRNRNEDFEVEADWSPILIDRNCQQYQKFIIEYDNLITYNFQWEWSQIFTKTIIPHGSVVSLKFKIIKSLYNAIAIGISDHSNISFKTSLSLPNSIAYWGDREVWEGKKVKEEGIGFKSGDMVTMKVDTLKGTISWAVGNDLRAQHSSSILRDRSLHLMGYIEMYDRGDKIELLSSKLH